METSSQPLAGPPSRRWSLASLLGAIVTAFLASACCLGPLVFALLGLGGAGIMMKFEPYRPYFMALTLAFLGVGFYFTYRKPKRKAVSCAADDCGCEHPKSNRAGKIMLWISTVVVLAFMAFPYLAAHLF